MEVMQMFSKTNIRKIAIVDDDESSADMASLQIEDAGFEPIIIDGPFGNVNDLATFINGQAQGAVCDHRLSHHGYANFYGAKLVATLYDLNIPALLVTQYVEIDEDVSIRKWKRKIPIVLSRDETDPISIKKGLEECIYELSGNVPSTRVPHRTLLRITNIADESGEKVVDAIIPSWNPRKAVRFPVSLIPENLRNELKQDIWLFALVNIDAEESADLYFDKFELAPEPDDDDGLA